MENPLGWQTRSGLINKDFERSMKGTLEVERLGLKELYEGKLEGRLIYWGPRRIF